MTKPLLVSQLLLRYPNAQVDGYDLFVAAEALARYLNCSRVKILEGALKSEKAARILIEFAKRWAT